VCDAPASSKCTCHIDGKPTCSSEQAEALKRVSAKVVPFPIGQLLLENKLKSSIDTAKKNISSGEDAFIDGHIIEYAE
jgi:hypothetical protein